jgi:DNA-binding response OmpR family regulator
MSTQKHILIVDTDHAPWARLQAIWAGQAEAPPIMLHAATGAEAASIATSRGPLVDAMVIEAELPDEHGAALCERLRARGLRLPIIVVGAHDSEAEAVHCLDAGANDYVARPVRAAELAARLRAQLRAFAAIEDAELLIGPYVFRPASRHLQERGGTRRIRLTEKETAVLKHLHRAAGSPVGRKALLREVWGYSPNVSTHTVETHIYRLRRKIEPDAARITLLVNEDGGYRLDPDWQPEPIRHWLPKVVLAGVPA